MTADALPVHEQRPDGWVYVGGVRSYRWYELHYWRHDGLRVHPRRLDDPLPLARTYHRLRRHAMAHWDRYHPPMLEELKAVGGLVCCYHPSDPGTPERRRYLTYEYHATVNDPPWVIVGTVHDRLVAPELAERFHAFFHRQMQLWGRAGYFRDALYESIKRRIYDQVGGAGDAYSRMQAAYKYFKKNIGAHFHVRLDGVDYWFYVTDDLVPYEAPLIEIRVA